MNQQQLASTDHTIFSLQPFSPADFSPRSLEIFSSDLRDQKIIFNIGRAGETNVARVLLELLVCEEIL